MYSQKVDLWQQLDTYPVAKLADQFGHQQFMKRIITLIPTAKAHSIGNGILEAFITKLADGRTKIERRE